MRPVDLSRRLTRGIGCAVFTVLTFASTVCFGQVEPPAPVTIRMANLGIGVNNFIQELAVEKGIFAKHGVDLKVTNFIKGGAEAIAGVAGGELDMGNFGAPILTGISFGLPIKIVGSSPNKGMNFELVARPGINSVKDLKGKVVACGALGGGNHQSLLKILRDNGLTETDVSVVATGGTDAAMILRSGKVDAVVTGELVRLKAEDDGTGRLLAKARDYYGKYQNGFVFAEDKFIKEHPDTIRNYFLATRESLEYARDHLDEIVDFTVRLTKIKRDLIKNYYLEQIALWDLSFAVDQEGTANAVNFLRELKEVKPNTSFDPKTWIDQRFLS
jgi:ABC-type nitrate/sulfonate/bicarbonate transport system substrate-binding protein